MPAEAGSPNSSGLLASLSRAARTLLGAVSTRLEIAGTELEEERIRLVQLLLFVASVVFCFAVALLLLVALVVVLLWDTHRLATLAIFAGAFLAAGITLALMLRSWLRSRPRLFAVTLAELEKDRARMQGRL